MNSSASSGFSLVELAITVLIMGMLLAFGVPAIRGLSDRYQLRGAIDNISGQLRLARETAIATADTQYVHFSANYQSSDYHIHNHGLVDPKWKLPNHISYYWGTGTQWEYRMLKDGRCVDSGMIILEDTRGKRDTVSVQASGLVLSK